MTKQSASISGAADHRDIMGCTAESGRGERHTETSGGRQSQEQINRERRGNFWAFFRKWCEMMERTVMGKVLQNDHRSCRKHQCVSRNCWKTQVFSNSLFKIENNSTIGKCDRVLLSFFCVTFETPAHSTSKMATDIAGNNSKRPTCA